MEHEVIEAHEVARPGPRGAAAGAGALGELSDSDASGDTWEPLNNLSTNCDEAIRTLQQSAAVVLLPRPPHWHHLPPAIAADPPPSAAPGFSVDPPLDRSDQP